MRNGETQKKPLEFPKGEFPSCLLRLVPHVPATDNAGVPNTVAVAVLNDHLAARLRLVRRLEANDLYALASERFEFIADLDQLAGFFADEFPLGHDHAFRAT